MRTCICGNKLKHIKNGRLEFPTKVAGSVWVKPISYDKCNYCKEMFLDSKNAQIYSDQASEAERKLIDKLPIGEFISSSEAEEILSIEKGKLRKNPRIRRGMIFNFKIGGRYLYHLKSVELFKKKNDGRFKLKK